MKLVSFKRIDEVYSSKEGKTMVDQEFRCDECRSILAEWEIDFDDEDQPICPICERILTDISEN